MFTLQPAREVIHQSMIVIFVILTSYMSRSILKFFALLACLSLIACAQKPGEQKAEFFIFGTVMEVTIWGADEPEAQRAFASLQSQFQEMHHDWHAWEPGPLTEINQAFASGLPAQASHSIVEMIRHSQLIEEQSGGRFNPAIGALVRLWGFHTSDYPIVGPPPGQLQIDALVARNPSSLDIQLNGLTMTSTNPAVQLDFGGIAKGYAIDIACDNLKNLGIDNAIVNAGGDLRAFGSHGDRPWRIAVRDPAGGIIAALEAGQDEAIFTSGNYERFRQDNESRYPHILDPRTGWPVKDLASVTVITREGWLADAAATALIVAGLDDWVEVARSLGLDQVLLVDETGKAYLTEKMNQRMEFVEGVEKEIVIF
jgi:thiamine biosynthesis lipoprotein